MIRRRTSVIPLGVFILITAGSTAIWWHIEQHQYRHLVNDPPVTARRAAKLLESWVQDRVSVIEHIAGEWSQHYQDHSTYFSSSAQKLMDRFPGLQTMNWIDPAGVIRIVVPDAGNEQALGKNLHDHPQAFVRSAITRATSTGLTTRTQVVELYQGGAGFALLSPIMSDEGILLGFVSGVFRIQSLVETCLNDSELLTSYHIDLRETSGQSVFRRGDDPPSESAPHAASAPVSMIDNPWLLTLTPSSSFIAAANSPVDEFGLAGGILVAFVLAWFIRLSMMRCDSLLLSEKRFRSLVENIPGLVHAYDVQPDGRRTLRFLGPGLDDLVGPNLAKSIDGDIIRFFDLIPPDDQADLMADAGRAVKGGGSLQHEFRIRLEDESFKWIRTVSSPTPREEGVIRWEGVLFDVTDRKQLELLREGRHRVVERLAENAPLPEVLTLLAESAESLFPEMLCSVLVLDARTRCLSHGAAPSLPDFYNEAIDGLQIGPMTGSCGAAAYTGKRVIAEDVMSHPNWTAYRELASRANIRACWSEPIISSTGEVLGTFAMYHRTPKTPTNEESTLIEASAQLAGIAIERTRYEESFQDLITGTASVTGKSFFPILVKHLARAVGVRYAMVTELRPDNLLHTLAFWCGDRESEPQSYSVESTPCEIVLLNGEYFCARDLQRKFPRDQVLVTLEAESYYGVTLCDVLGRTIGHLCVLDDKPMVNRDRIISIIRLFAIRAAAELDRIRASKKIRRQATIERMLRNELDHRVRNNLASLNTLVDLSRRTARNPDQFAAAIKRRIETMATAHGLLSQSHNHDVGLHQIVFTLSPPEYKKQIILQGDPVIVPADKVSALAMVMHELLSNCMKHGAMSVETGRVRIVWGRNTDQDDASPLILRWEESGGPALEAEPTPGVGTSLITGLVRSDLQGVVELRFPPSGAHHTLTLNLQPTEPPVNPPSESPVDPPVIVEDKPAPQPAIR